MESTGPSHRKNHKSDGRRKMTKSKATPETVKKKVKAKDVVDAMGDERDQERRRRKKLARYAKRMAEHLAELGLDENGNRLDNFSLLKYPVREWQFTIPGFREPIAMNPAVNLIGGVCLWLILLWTLVQPTASLETILKLRTSVSMSFTWFLQGGKVLFFVFLLYILYKYGHIHLGHKHETPEFSTVSYFSMIFASGAGPALLYYAVQEPLWHQMSNFFVQAGYRSQDEVDMFAINMTISEWGITCWTHYTIVAVAMSLAVHRFNLPLTFRSCFYPILGAYTWGWIGDFIDGIAVVVTIAGSCTFLGTSVIQIVNGFIRMGWVDERITQQEVTSIQNMTVWVIIFASTAAVVSGLRAGIRLMSKVSMALAFLLLILVFLMDDTKYLLNLQVQEAGMFLQMGLFQLNFWTDAFGQVRAGSGRAVDGKSAEQWWMDAWTIYFIAWVITCSIGVGAFVACISRGRKLWEVIVHSLGAPIAYCLVWFCTWGGIALRQSRQGLELEALGATYYNNSAHFLASGSEVCYDVPQEDIVVDDNVVFTNYHPGITPVCTFDAAQPDAAAFNLLYSFQYPGTYGSNGLGPWLSALYILCIALLYVATSDSAVLVVDSLASNGRKNYHWSRRLYWASTVGALTTALLSSGGAEALSVVQAASIVCGLPVGVLLCYLLQSITLMCHEADKMGTLVADYQFPDQPEFDTPIVGGIFNVLEYVVSFGKVNPARVDLGMDCATRPHVVEFVKGLVVPFVSLHKVLTALYPSNPKTNTTLVVLYAFGFIGWVCLVVAMNWYDGLEGIAGALFLATGVLLATVRSGFRQQHNLRSNIVADFTSSMIAWPQVLMQMRLQSVVSDDVSRSKKHDVNSTDEDDLQPPPVSTVGEEKA